MIKIGVVGGGLNSAVGIAHYSAIQLSSNYTIAAGCFSRNEDLNKRTGEFLNLNESNIYSSFEELLINNKNEIDTILILTPTDQHFKQVIMALEAGFNVICEKALTQCSKDCLKIKETLEHTKKELFVIYNYLGYPMIKETKAMIDDDKLGEILHIQVEMPQESFIKVSEGKPIRPQSWRLKDENIPTISLDLGVHLHMMIHYLTGKKPMQVIASSKTFGHFQDIIDDIKAIIRYEDNVECQMWYSKVAIGYRNGLKIRITGTKAAIEWYQMEPEIIHFAKNTGELSVIDRITPGIKIAHLEKYNRFKGGHPIGFTEALANYYSDIAEELLSPNNKNRSKEAFGIDEANEGLMLFEAISISSKEQRWINI